MLAGVVNTIAGRVHPSFANGGEIVPLRHPDAIRGAALVRNALDVTPHADRRPSFDSLRLSRPLLTAARVVVPADGSSIRLTFAAATPGNDFAAPGREASPVSIYVNGRYHSDVLALAERSSRYAVNLAGLPPGEHHVELRFSRDVAGPAAVTPRIAHLKVKPVRGEQALLARYAPIVETRWSPAFERGAMPDQFGSDVPLAMVSIVQPQSNGTRRLRYYLMTSNEDTSGFPFATIFRKFGRTTDYELMYEVWVRPDGSKVDDRFQGPLHIRWRFEGEHQGDRPVVRVTTRNGMFASNSYRVSPRWSEMPIGRWNHVPEDRELMLAQPWMFAVMGKENIREGRSAPRGATPLGNKQAYDAREHLYFEARDPARLGLERSQVVTAVLHDGRRVRFRVSKEDFRPPPPGLPPRSTAVALPPWLPSSTIAGLDLPPGRVFTLDEDFKPRQLALRARGQETAAGSKGTGSGARSGGAR